MFIVKRNQFMNELRDRKNIIYSELQNYSICGLYRGIYYNEYDFLTMDLIDTNLNFEELTPVIDKAKADKDYKFELDLNCCQRDGLFNDHQYYVIYEKSDILKLINELYEILKED